MIVPTFWMSVSPCAVASASNSCKKSVIGSLSCPEKYGAWGERGPGMIAGPVTMAAIAAGGAHVGACCCGMGG